MAEYEAYEEFLPEEEDVYGRKGWEHMETPEETPAEKKAREAIEIENQLCKDAIKTAKKEEKKRVLGLLRSVAHNYARGLEVAGGEEDPEEVEVKDILHKAGLREGVRGRGGKRTRKTKKHTKKHHKKHTKKHNKKH